MEFENIQGITFFNVDYCGFAFKCNFKTLELFLKVPETRTGKVTIRTNYSQDARTVEFVTNLPALLIIKHNALELFFIGMSRLTLTNFNDMLKTHPRTLVKC